MPILKIKNLKNNLEKIQFLKDGDAGIDLRASGEWIIDLDNEKKEITADQYTIKPLERIAIKTGISLEIPKGYWGNVRDRSGLAFKHGLHCLAGVIDENYRGEIIIIIINLSQKEYTIEKNERIAQLIISPYEKVEIEYTDTLSDSERNEKGFGSSGKI